MMVNGGEKAAPQGVAGAHNEAALLRLMERTGFPMIQENGQRKYGPPPKWEGPPPPRGCEIFVGKIPRDCYEDELVPAFEKVGKIYELRLMMDFSGSNRGYAFVMYTNKQDSLRAVKEMNNFEIRKGRLLGVCPSVDNCRLFVGGIPKSKNREEILSEMEKVTDGVRDVIVYPSATDKSKNRGFAFVEYESHRTAAMARRKLIPGRIQLWGHQIAVDWAEPEQEVDEETMCKVKILYVRNLMLATSEDTILQEFTNACGREGAIERVKKLKDYAFVHFKNREDAIKAMNIMNGGRIDGAKVEVVLAKPVDKAEYLRYSRTKNALVPQDEVKDEEMNSVVEAFGYSMNFSDSGLYEQVYGPNAQLVGSDSSRGMGRTAVGIRGALRGRGRGAAGSRGAGARAYVPAFRGAYQRRYPPEGRLYDLLPGMELTPTNPVTLKPQTVKSPVQFLEEICQKNGWGSPNYQLHSTMTRDGSGDIQLFLFKVTIPALGPHQPTKLCRTVEEAKVLAADYCLSKLGIPCEGQEVVNPYQGRPLGPTPFPLTNGVPAPHDLTYTSTIPVVTSASYVVAGKMPPPPPPQIAGEYGSPYDYHQPGYPAGQPGPQPPPVPPY